MPNTERLISNLPPVHDLHSEGSWFRSSVDGRYVQLRGVCFGPSAKLEPFLPFREQSDWDKFETYVDLLLACGQTTLRLPFVWSAFEPTCDPKSPVYDEQYFSQFFYYVDKFADKGFLIFIDLHQDLVGKAFGGNGLPEWVRSEGVRDFSIFQNTPLWGLNYVFNKHLRKTFTEFWNNDLTNRTATPPLEHFKVRDRFLDCIERIAQRAATNPRVLGIEIFNEPHPAMIKDRHFEEEILPTFYSEALARIRRHSKDLYAFVSPQSDWNANVKSEKRYESYLAKMGDDERLVFAYHYYDSLLTGLHGLHFHDAKRDEYIEAQHIGVRQAKAKGMLPFLTEFGTRQNWKTSIVRQHMNWHYEGVEQSLTNATYWNVNLYNTAIERDGFMREDFSLIGHSRQARNLDVLTRPYVLLASAEPVHMEFNLRSKEFELVLIGKPLAVATVIYVPAVALHPLQPVHYRGEIVIEYNGKLDAKLAGNELSIILDPGIELHRIRIFDPLRSEVSVTDGSTHSGRLLAAEV